MNVFYPCLRYLAVKLWCPITAEQSPIGDREPRRWWCRWRWWLEWRPSEEGEVVMWRSSVARRCLQARMTDTQWMLIGLKKAGWKIIGLDLWCHNQLDSVRKWKCGKASILCYLLMSFIRSWLTAALVSMYDRFTNVVKQRVFSSLLTFSWSQEALRVAAEHIEWELSWKS